MAVTGDYLLGLLDWLDLLYLWLLYQHMAG